MKNTGSNRARKKEYRLEQDARLSEGLQARERACAPFLELLDQRDDRDYDIAAVRQLSADVGIPANLHGILKEEDIQFLAESAYADACRPGNPRDTSVEEIVELYKSQL